MRPIHTFIRSSPLVLAAALIVGCAERANNPAAPSPVIANTGITSESAQTEDTILTKFAGSGNLPDLQGIWAFRERIWVLQPSALNPIIGAPTVDRPMTQVVCEAEGTLDLEQEGARFWGTATQSVVCQVAGVHFVPPAFAFNPEFAVRNGRIHGHSVYFETGHIIGDGDVVPTQGSDCANRGSIRIRGEAVEALRTIGSCPVPFDPGEQHSSWEIRRP
jgi:hypothetical protein